MVLGPNVPHDLAISERGQPWRRILLGRVDVDVPGVRGAFDHEGTSTTSPASTGLVIRVSRALVNTSRSPSSLGLAVGVDADVTGRITPEHAVRLAWFEDHQGQITGLPVPLENGLRLVSKPKGVYKPADLPYALSIRTNLGSNCHDGVPLETEGGGWLLSYHQEDDNPAERDSIFTKAALMRCIDDLIPVGVLRATS